MKLSITSAPLAQNEAEALIVGLHTDGVMPTATAELNQATDGLIAGLAERREHSGKVGETLLLHRPSGIQAAVVAVVGLGAADKFGRGEMFRAAAAAALTLAAKPRGCVASYLAVGAEADLAEAAIAGAVVGCRGQDLYRAEKKRTPPEHLEFGGVDEAHLEAGRTLGDSVNLTRELVNEPPHAMYPESFAARAEQVARESGLECEIWDTARLEAERCGALLAVAKGSQRPPRLVILRHRGAPADSPTVALVGKGVTFDSGGLSLKPSDSMVTMKCDMAGAATVLGTMQAIARRKIPVNVIGLMGLVENMPSGTAMKLGDVLTARNGKTIEVLNTDAEGRLVLADVLSVAVDLGVSRIVDLATLTGACVVALGLDVAGLMTNDQAWCDSVARAADVCGERAWQLPMFAEYAEQIRGDVADIRNTGQGRWGGAITAAKFLEEFVGNTPWVHIDIAGPAFADKPKPWTDGGGSGVMVRTLVELIGAARL